MRLNSLLLHHRVKYSNSFLLSALLLLLHIITGSHERIVKHITRDRNQKVLREPNGHSYSSQQPGYLYLVCVHDPFQKPKGKSLCQQLPIIPIISYLSEHVMHPDLGGES
jgi:hypothetical protein